jgi:hypothetical protein
MSKPSRRPGRQNRPKTKHTRDLRRPVALELDPEPEPSESIRLPTVIGFHRPDGTEVEFTLDCDACWARIHGQPTNNVPYHPRCEFCDPDRKGHGWPDLPDR